AVEALHVMRGLWRHRAALSRLQAIAVPWRARLDHHRACKADKAVGDVGMVMPGHLLSRRQSQDRDAHIGAFGNDLAAGDLVTAAIAVLHRSILSPDARITDFGHRPRACRAGEIGAASTPKI